MGKRAQSTRPLRQTQTPIEKQKTNAPYPEAVALKQQTTAAPTTTPVIRQDTSLAQVPQTNPKSKKPTSKPKKRKPRKCSTCQQVPITTNAHDEVNAQTLIEEEFPDQSIQGSREDELPGYNNDEIAFLKDVLKGTRIRPDNMIELPLPFAEDSPKFVLAPGDKPVESL